MPRLLVKVLNGFHLSGACIPKPEASFVNKDQDLVQMGEKGGEESRKN